MYKNNSNKIILKCVKYSIIITIKLTIFDDIYNNL